MAKDELEGHALFGYASETGTVFVLAEVCDDGTRRPLRFEHSQQEVGHFAEHLEELELVAKLGPGQFFVTTPCLKGEPDWSLDPLPEPSEGWPPAERGPCLWGDTLIMPVALPPDGPQLEAIRRVSATGLSVGLDEDVIPEALRPRPGTAADPAEMVMLGSRDTVVTADGGHPVTFNTADGAKEFLSKMPAGRLVKKAVAELTVKKARDLIVPQLISAVNSGRLSEHLLVAWYNGSICFEILQLGERTWADNFAASSGSTH